MRPTVRADGHQPGFSSWACPALSLYHRTYVVTMAPDPEGPAWRRNPSVTKSLRTTDLVHAIRLARMWERKLFALIDAGEPVAEPPFDERARSFLTRASNRTRSTAKRIALQQTGAAGSVQSSYASLAGPGFELSGQTIVGDGARTFSRTGGVRVLSPRSWRAGL